MKTSSTILLALLLAYPFGTVRSDGTIATRAYTNRQVSERLGAAVFLRGTAPQIQTLSRWLDQIACIPKGAGTLDAIAQSGHRLLILHNAHCVLSAGRTTAPMSMNLINGNGESVEIRFNAEIPDGGSHMVYDGKGRLIEYTATQNLYHELAHAAHKMNGTWRYFDSEKQAIEEENIFRSEQAAMQGRKPQARFRKSGVMISDVGNTIAVSEWFGPSILETGWSVPADPKVSSAGVLP